MLRAVYLPLVVLVNFAILFAGGAETPSPLGIFESHSDVGEVLHPGSALYDPSAKSYTVTGSGENMWFAADDFQFVWKKISDENVSLSADISILGSGGDNHRKAVLMIRQSLDSDAAYADAALHGDGLTSLQYREEKGAVTHEVESNVSAPQRLSLRKRGDRFFLSIGNAGQDLRLAGGSVRVPLKAPFYIGVGVCAHNKDAVQKAAFAHVELTTGLAGEPASFSTLETVAVASTDARVVFVSTDRMELPEYTASGSALLFRVGAVVKSIPAEGGSPETLSPPPDRAPASTPNRVSPDGLFVAEIVPAREDMELSVVSLADRTRKTIAKFAGKESSLSAHPWSPDSKRLTFVSYQQIP